MFAKPKNVYWVVTYGSNSGGILDVFSMIIHETEELLQVPHRLLVRPSLNFGNVITLHSNTFTDDVPQKGGLHFFGFSLRFSQGMFQ